MGKKYALRFGSRRKSISDFCVRKQRCQRWYVNECLKEQMVIAEMKERSFEATGKDILKSIDKQLDCSDFLKCLMKNKARFKKNRKNNTPKDLFDSGCILIYGMC